MDPVLFKKKKKNSSYQSLLCRNEMKFFYPSWFCRLMSFKVIMFVDWRWELRSVAELSGIFKNRGFKKSAFTVVSKKLCGAAAVDPVGIETKIVGRSVAWRLCSRLQQPGWYGCAHVWGTGPATGWCMCAPCFKFALSVDSPFKAFSMNTCNSLSKQSRVSTILD